ncbi:hypothetical protein KIN20_016241 [Parelaphostrongylus tenuis]|uniref:Uncharacterized protein n=1 Tax=Parelaphostrongylus tenuis TaxID=148309 RepID=A0AAD5N164_PARTN|nr:hypothetical protein KIN20_016241 [Parelaphostrongylus tenuis]
MADEPPGSNPRTGATILSKWQTSFDASCGDFGEAKMQENQNAIGTNRSEPTAHLITNRPNLRSPSKGTLISNPPSQPVEVQLNATSFSPVSGQRLSRIEKEHPPMHRAHSCGTPQSSSIISHFKGLINSFNNLGCGNRLSRGVSVDEVAKADFDADRDSSYKMRSSTSTGLRISPAVTTSKIAARVSAVDCNDDEKEQRRQRRLGRRSIDSNARVPLPSAASPMELPPSPIRLVQRSVVHAPVESVMKLRDVGDDEQFRIPLEDNNKPLLFYKRKRYQFLNFPKASSKS